MAKTFTAGIDSLLGTDADDIFEVMSGADVNRGDSLDGGVGNDTLEIVNGGTIDLSVLARMNSIETIKGSVSGDVITLSNAQMLGITSLDGGEGIDNLRLTGATFDLTGKVIEGFEKITLVDGVREVTTDDFEIARLIDAKESQDDTLNYTGSVPLNDTQRQELFDHGIDKIIEQDGTVTVNRAPVMSGLSGNSVITVPEGSVCLDDGGNMTIGGEDNDLSLLQIEVRATDNGVSEFHLDISIEGTGILLSDGLNPGSRVFVDDVEVGIFNKISDPQYLYIDFFEAAARDLVEKLIRAVSFSSSSVDDPEATYRYEVKFHIEDNGGRASDATVKVMVAPEGTPIDNAPPSNVTIDGRGFVIVDESLAIGAGVGTLGADDESPETLTYSFASGFDGGGRFVIEGNTIKVKSALDYETGLERDEKGRFYRLKVTVTDDDAQMPLSSTEEIKIYVNDVNEAPTNIQFQNLKWIKAGVTLAGAEVVQASAVDPDGPAAFTDNRYRFSNGFTTDGIFTIDEKTGQITTRVAVSDDDTGLHRLSVEVYDASKPSLFYRETYDITILSSENTPPNKPVSVEEPVAVNENVAGPTVVATVQATDADPEQTLHYVLVNDFGGKFSIGAATGVITLNGPVDFEATDAGLLLEEGTGRKYFLVEVKAVDDGPGNLSSEIGEVKIYINDLNEAPTIPVLVGETVSVEENKAGSTIVATVQASDADAGQALTYALVNDFGGKFTVDPSTGVITLNGPVDFEMDADLTTEQGTGRKYFNLQVKASDGELTSQPSTVKIYIDDVDDNASPSQPNLTSASVSEGAAIGTKVGVLGATDPEGDSVHYELADNPGGFFTIVGNELRVARSLDFETARTHRITVKAVDSHGASSSEATFEIAVGDVLETVAGSSKGKNVLIGGIGADKLNGGYGNDTLTGNGGQDVFIFDSKLGTAATDRKVNFDTITDFKVGEDKIWLDNAIFKKLGKGTEAAPGTLNKKFFVIGDKAKDKDDYLIYNKKTGILSYDADGSGKGAAVEFAKLAKNLKLSVSDFLIV